MEKTKLITEKENQMKTRWNKFHCCLDGGKAETPKEEIEEEIPPAVTQIRCKSTLISLLHFYLIVLAWNYAYAMLRQGKRSSTLSAVGIPEDGAEQLPPATTIRQHLPATDRDMPVKMWA